MEYLPLSIAAQFSAPNDKSGQGLDLAVISEGAIATANGYAGCIVYGAPVDIDATVGFKPLIKAVNKLGRAPSLTLKNDKLLARKGRTSVTLPTTKRPALIRTNWPDASLQRISMPERLIAALQAAATIQRDDNSAVFGVRLAAGLAASCTSTSIIAVQDDALDALETPVTLHPKMFKGLDTRAPYNLIPDGDTYWFERPADHAAWTRALAGTYPDALVNSHIGSKFTSAGRVPFTVDIDALLQTLDTASVLLDGDEPATMCLAGDHLEIKGRFLRGEFEDAIKVESSSESSAVCGFYLYALVDWLKAVKGAAMAMAGETCATITICPDTIGDWQTAPILLESGPVKAVLMPCRA
jgi:hypothetical protein